MRKYSVLLAALLTASCSLTEPAKQAFYPEANSIQVGSAKETEKEVCKTFYRHKRTQVRQCQPIKQEQ